MLLKTKYYDRYDYSFPACMDATLDHVQNLIKWKMCVSYTDGRRVWNIIGRDNVDPADVNDHYDPRYHLRRP